MDQHLSSAATFDPAELSAEDENKALSVFPSEIADYLRNADLNRDEGIGSSAVDLLINLLDEPELPAGYTGEVPLMSLHQITEIVRRFLLAQLWNAYQENPEAIPQDEQISEFYDLAEDLLLDAWMQTRYPNRWKALAAAYDGDFETLSVDLVNEVVEQRSLAREDQYDMDPGEAVSIALNELFYRLDVPTGQEASILPAVQPGDWTRLMVSMGVSTLPN